jgi:flavorubredoxin
MTDNPAYRSHVFKDANALVVYASTHGHTAKIAARIAAAVRDEGLEVDLRDVADAAAASPAATTSSSSARHCTRNAIRRRSSTG